MTLLRQSVLLNILFILESAFGFLIDIGIALTVGATASSDALYAAWIIPQTIGRGIFQSLSHSLLGLFGEAKAADASPTTGIDSPPISSALHGLYGQIILVMSIVGAFSSGLLLLSRSAWVQFTIAGAHISTQSIAIEITSIVGWLPLPLALSETLRSIYYFEERSTWPSVFRIIGLLVTLSCFGLSSFSIVSFGDLTKVIAGSILLGAIIEAVLSLVGIRLLLMHWPLLRLPNMSVLKQIVTTAGIPFAGVFMLMLASTGERMIASFFGPGTITLVTYANRIITSIERFVFRGLLISATKAALSDGFRALRSSMQIALLFSLLVASCLLFVTPLAIPLVFSGGQFTADSAQQLTLILQIYSFAAIGLALSRVPFGYVFAQNRTKNIFGFYLLTGVVLLAAELLLFGLGFGVMLFGVGYSIAMWVGYFYLHRVTQDSLEIRWRTIFGSVR